uniref:RNA-directed RNA polymerase L n=1 Tax=Buffalo Bayou virus TaxID=2651592 RepID=A0A5P8HZY8_9VIRU|nr:RNA-dependent RNA polymerase [Buffalo Bayou virus]
MEIEEHLLPENVNRIYNEAMKLEDGGTAADYVDVLYKIRHDIWGYIVSSNLHIPIRDDIPIDVILAELGFSADYIKDNKLDSIRQTPDNFFIVDTQSGSELHVIDYKVQVQYASSKETYESYKKIFSKLITNTVKVHVHVIHLHPNDLVYRIIGDPIEFRLRDRYHLNEITNVTNKISDIRKKFSNDESFISRLTGDIVEKEMPWVLTDIEKEYNELRQDEDFSNFVNSMPTATFQKLERHLLHQRENNTAWNEHLEKDAEEYDDIIENIADNIKESDGEEFYTPSGDIINQSWANKEFEMVSKYDLHEDMSKQKPSAHFTWNPDTEKVKELFPTNENTKKIQILALLLKSLTGGRPIVKFLNLIGKSASFGDNFHECLKAYEEHMLEQENKRIEITEELKKYKTDKVLNKKDKTKKLYDKCQIGDAIVGRRQEFYFSKGMPEKVFREAKTYYFNKCKIRMRKRATRVTNVSDKLEENIEMLHPFCPSVIAACEELYTNTRDGLSGPHDMNLERYFCNIVERQIKESGNDTVLDHYKSVTKSNFFKCCIDISNLLKAAVVSSKFVNRDTFRIMACGSKSTYLLLLPSDCIQKKDGQVLYSIITIHEGASLDFGCNEYTFSLDKSLGLNITITKPLRLDKVRLKRLINLPQQFLMTCFSFLNERKVPINELNDIMTFSFYLSTSCTKSMLSLAEPSRYILMNSLSLLSDVKSFIEEKFEPRTKTFFSVYFFNKVVTASLKVNTYKNNFVPKRTVIIDDQVESKGIEDKATFPSIWFDRYLTIKEFINEIYTPSYTNAKNLHVKSHNIISLLKVPIEIEDSFAKDWRPWNYPDSQTVDINLFISSIAKFYNGKRVQFKRIRANIEQKSNFKKKIFSIDTMTSSKSCLQVGNTRAIKNKYFIEKEISNKAHLTERDLPDQIKDYTKYVTNKVFDDLYLKIKEEGFEKYDKPFVELGFESMNLDEQIYVTMFEKGQRTAVDREIYQTTLRNKMALYVIERIYKGQSNEEDTEQISKPGDSKMKEIQRVRIQTLKDMTKNANNESMKDNMNIILELNADMSKWSAKDIFYKYFILIMMDPTLYTQEKIRILKFFSRYLRKELIVPDQAMIILKEQVCKIEGDLLRAYTKEFTSNTFKVGQNWLQGNFNYMSSFVHSICMMAYRDLNTLYWARKKTDCATHSMVHSDDNQTSIVMSTPIFDKMYLARKAMYMFTDIEKRFGFIVNTKKTYINEIIKEFVSIFNLNGEPFSVISRFLLPVIAETSYLGPYQDLASRLSSVQTALRHGCIPSIGFIAIQCAAWSSYETYSMMPGNRNDPCKALCIPDRRRIPLELGGYPNMNLGEFQLIGIECHDLRNLLDCFAVTTNGDIKRGALTSDALPTLTLDVEPWMSFYVKYIRHFTLDQDLTLDINIGESYDMRSRSILNPKLFQSVKLITKMESYNDFNAGWKIDNHENLLKYIKENIFLTIGKAESSEEYMNMIKYRYFSRRFKEGLSTTNQVHLFIEQVLASNTATIDLHSIYDTLIILTEQEITAFNKKAGFDEGTYTIEGALEVINIILTTHVRAPSFDHETINIVYRHKFLTDPAITSIISTNLIYKKEFKLKNDNCYVEKMPQFNIVRNIETTPANLIRYKETGKIPDFSKIDEAQYISDLAVLQEFEEAVDAAGKMEMLRKKYQVKGVSEVLVDIAVKTNYLQMLYSYLQQNNYKNKYSILPARSRDIQHFINIVLGSKITDGYHYRNRDSGYYISDAPKAKIQENKQSDYTNAKLYLRAVGAFCETFFTRTHQIAVFNEILECTSYKGRTGRELLELAMSRTDIRRYLHSIAFHMGYLKYDDISSLKIKYDKPKVRWGKAQFDRYTNIGPIDVSVSTNKATLFFLGCNKKLDEARLEISHGVDINATINLYCKVLLGAGFDISSLEIERMNDRDYYLASRIYYKGYKKTYSFIIANKSDLDSMDKDHIYRPLCPIYVSPRVYKIIPNDQVIALNKMNKDIMTFHVGENIKLHIPRVPGSFLKGVKKTKDTNLGFDLVNYMKSGFANNVQASLLNVPYIDIVNLFTCHGNDFIDAFEFDILNDDPVIGVEHIEIRNDLYPVVEMSTESNKGYKNAVQEAISTICKWQYQKLKINGRQLDPDMIKLEDSETGEDEIYDDMEYFFSILQIANALKIDTYFHPMVYVNGHDGVYHNTTLIPESVYDGGQFNLHVAIDYVSEEIRIDSGVLNNRFRKLQEEITEKLKSMLPKRRNRKYYKSLVVKNSQQTRKEFDKDDEEDDDFLDFEF